MTDTFRFGIEEEYFLVDAETKSVARGMSHSFFQAAKTALGEQVSGELLQSQIEVATTPHVDVGAAHAELRHLRQGIARTAGEHGLGIIAAGTHPTATWDIQRQTPGQRYDNVRQDLQMLAQRNMLCGLHVHVEVPDAADRVDLMTRMLPYLPLFVALATSSPFWQSHLTGLKSYRLAAYDELPRTGVPELFRSEEEFDAYVGALTRAGVIEDASYVWWAIRPSLRYPTLELRAPDCCTRLDDSVSIASLYRALVRRLVRNPSLNSDLDAVGRALVIENKWRAQRYGVHGTFVDNGAIITVSEKLEQTIEDLAADADALGCVSELQRCREIVQGGTSADRQIAAFAAHEPAEERERALRAVTDWIAHATLESGT